MKTVREEVVVTFREKGSKFLGYLYPVNSVEVFESKLEQLKSRYPDATHHCYAYRIDPVNLQEFGQDDGEPGGTAGLPILNRLKSAGVVNAGLIVVRYYGGTNLGKSGLIEAYGATAQGCLESAEFLEVVRTVNVEISYPYHRQNQVDKLKAVYNLTELDSEYLEKVTLRLACPEKHSKEFFEELERITHLDIEYQKLGEGFVSK